MTAPNAVQVRERATVASYIVFGAFFILLSAFFYAQVLSADTYQQKANQIRYRDVRLTAPRGMIFDRHGVPIAENSSGFSVRLLVSGRHPEDSLRAVLQRVLMYAPGPEGIEVQVFKRYGAAPYQPVLVYPNASFTAVSALEEHRYLLPGLNIQTEPRRSYSTGSAVAHLVGYVAEANEKEIQKGKIEPGTLIGKGGIEAAYDSIVRGEDGRSVIQVDRNGRVVQIQSRRSRFGTEHDEDDTDKPLIPPRPGRPLETTIDLDLQTFIKKMWDSIPNVRGAMIAMTPDGQILALYSAPSFDPNDFVTGLSQRQYDSLTNPITKPLYNRAIQGAFPPGSPFKLVTAAIGLKRGVVTMNSMMPQSCNGAFRLGNRPFRCWKPEGHGRLNLKGAIAQSCNVYFYQLGLRIGLENFLHDAYEFGLGQTTGIDLPSEQRSNFPADFSYFDKKWGKYWSKPATSLNFAIGQGEVTQTLISMVRFYAALAGNGTIPTPYVVKPRIASIGTLGLTPTQLADIRAALEEVTKSGTARRARLIGGDRDRLAGKTGTAQNPHGDDHGWFLGFAPADNPRIVVGAIMEFAEHGSNVAPYVGLVVHHFLCRNDPSCGPPPKVVTMPDSSVTEPPADSTDSTRQSIDSTRQSTDTTRQSTDTTTRRPTVTPRRSAGNTRRSGEATRR